MTTRQARVIQRQKRAHNDLWTRIVIVLLMVSLLALKLAVNTAFKHDLVRYQATQGIQQ